MQKILLHRVPLKHSIAKQYHDILTTTDAKFTAYSAEWQLAVSEVIEPTRPSMIDLDVQKKSKVVELSDKPENLIEATRLVEFSGDNIDRHRKQFNERGLQSLKLRIPAKMNIDSGGT